MNQIRRRKTKIEKISFWTLSIIFTAAITAVVTWYITNSLTNSEKTKVYDYAYIEKSEPKHAEHGSAECWNGIAARFDAYKCGHDSKIYAPCFRDDIADRVKCPGNPKNDNDAKYFKATFRSDSKPLMDSYGKEPIPWYIYLKSGDECRFVYGATTTIANKRLDFICNSGKATLYLPVKDNSGAMTISCLKNDALEQCEISELWR